MTTNNELREKVGNTLRETIPLKKERKTKYYPNPKTIWSCDHFEIFYLEDGIYVKDITGECKLKVSHKLVCTPNVVITKSISLYYDFNDWSLKIHDKKDRTIVID
jgi:hypothetical protein